MLPDKEIGCHRTGFARKCRDLLVSGECNRYKQLQTIHPQTGETLGDYYDCVDNLQHILLLEIAQQARQAGASADKVATEVRRSSEEAAARDVHLINGIKASFPVMQIAQHLNAQRLLEEGDT